MDISVYNDLYDSVKTYMSTEYPSLSVVHFSPKQTKYPMLVLKENRNTPTYVARVGRQVTASLGYVFDIYASTVGNQTQQTIVRNIAAKIDTFMFSLNRIPRTSYNEFENVDGEGKVYRASIVYSMRYLENKKIIY